MHQHTTHPRHDLITECEVLSGDYNARCVVGTHIIHIAQSCLLIIYCNFTAQYFPLAITNNFVFQLLSRPIC